MTTYTFIILSWNLQRVWSPSQPTVLYPGDQIDCNPFIGDLTASSSDLTINGVIATFPADSGANNVQVSLTFGGEPLVTVWLAQIYTCTVGSSDPKPSDLSWSPSEPSILFPGDQIELVAGTGITLPSGWVLTASPADLIVTNLTATFPPDSTVNGISVNLYYGLVPPPGEDSGVTVGTLTLGRP